MVLISMNIQAFINNISFPKTIAELEYFIKEHGCFNVEDILNDQTTEWTVPKWAVVNDIVFFFHARTAIRTIRKLESELRRNRALYDYDVLMEGLAHARKLYDLYGGKIFAIGRVLGIPFYDEGESLIDLHWKGRIYAEIGDIYILENPVDINTFSDFIMVSRQSAITIVIGEDFTKLRSIISKTNKVPSYLIESTATPIPLNKINHENWLKLTQPYRRAFFLEMQFRKFYVDYLLQSIADNRKIFSECACYKKDKLVGYADNCIWLHGKLCFVEVKLNFGAERNLMDQLMKYSKVESTILGKRKRCFDNIEQRYVIVVDTKSIGVFNSLSKEIFPIMALDSLKDKTDLMQLRQALIEFIFADSFSSTFPKNAV